MSESGAVEYAQFMVTLLALVLIVLATLAMAFFNDNNNKHG